MKKFEIPSIEVDTLEVLDVITASTVECEDVPDCFDDAGIF